MKKFSPSRSRSTGFSLVELLVSMTILTAIMLLFVGILDQTQKTWNFAEGQISQFREARVAFDLMTKSISQATLNTYYEQVDKNGDGVPEDYIPKSELHFITLRTEDIRLQDANFEQIGPGQAIFFQAPLGVSDWNGGSEDPVYTRPDGKKDRLDLSALSNLLCARGYYVAFISDKNFRPAFLNSSARIAERKRYRLMEFIPPSEANKIYFDYAEEDASNPTSSHFQKWYKDAQDLVDYSRPLAENIVALCISPREPLADTGSSTAAMNISPEAVDRAMTSKIAPRFEYSSEKDMDGDGYFDHVLPPLVKITMIAIDETSAIQLEDRFDGRPYMKSSGGGLIPRPSWLTSAENLVSDLTAFSRQVEQLQESGMRIRYKIFSTTINIKSSKWSAR